MTRLSGVDFVAGCHRECGRQNPGNRYPFMAGASMTNQSFFCTGIHCLSIGATSFTECTNLSCQFKWTFPFSGNCSALCPIRACLAVIRKVHVSTSPVTVHTMSHGCDSVWVEWEGAITLRLKLWRRSYCVP